MASEQKRVLGRVLASEDIKFVSGGVGVDRGTYDVMHDGTDGLQPNPLHDPTCTNYSMDLTCGGGGDLAETGGGATDVFSDRTSCGLDYPEFP